MTVGSEIHRYLYVEESGPLDGEVILLLHGWGSSAQLMRPLASALESKYRVVNVDLPGHGHSPDPPEPLGVPEHAGLVADLIRTRTSTPINVVGHSNGGRIALYMAASGEMADLIKGLVLISPSGVRPRRTWKFHLRRFIAQALKAPFTLLPDRPRDLGLDWLRNSLVWKWLGSSDYRALSGVMRDTFVRTVNHYLDDRLGRVGVPTLIFWGDRDTAISREQIAVMEDAIEDVGVVVLTGAGHYGHLDDPETVVEGMLYFLSTTAERRPVPESDHV